MASSTGESVSYRVTQKTTRTEHISYGESEKNGSAPGKSDAKSSQPGVAIYVFAGLIGIVFGIAFEKARLCEPRFVRYQMSLNKFIFAKFILSTVATGLFAFSMMAMFPQTRNQFMKVCIGYYNHFNDKSVLSSMFGGAMMGVGITLSGSCPVTVFSQVGARVPSSLYVFGGCLMGTFIYGVTKKFWDGMFKPTTKESSNPWVDSPYFVMALPLVAMFGILVAAFEILVPWTAEIKVHNAANATFFEQKAWPPYVCGVILGSLQFPLVLILGQYLGGSSSFSCMVAQGMQGPLRGISPFFEKFRHGFGGWWQVWYVCGAMLGAYLSASASGSLGTAKGVLPMEAFIGGTIMLLGARISGGCTSGHGFSGLAFLTGLSFIVIPMQFFVGSLTACIMKNMDMWPSMD